VCLFFNITAKKVGFESLFHFFKYPLQGDFWMAKNSKFQFQRGKKSVHICIKASKNAFQIGLNKLFNVMKHPSEQLGLAVVSFESFSDLYEDFWLLLSSFRIELAT
jgi:hypothetical protein